LGVQKKNVNVDTCDQYLNKTKAYLSSLQSADEPHSAAGFDKDFTILVIYETL